MAWKTELNGYVKFLRGTPAAWAALETKDTDTLYFIAETNAERGKLYLGPKLISDGTVNIVSTLNDLQDVFISNGLPANAILVFNELTHRWESKPIETVLSLIITPMTGATESTDGTSGLVPVPVAGQQNLYLRGDATWGNPTAAVEREILNLRAGDVGSIRDIAANEVAKIVANADQDFDTLKEIADWILDHDSVIDVVDASARLEAVEKAVFGQDGTGETDGLIVDVSALNNAVFGDGVNAGLVSNVNTLKVQMSGVLGDVNTLQTNVTNLTTQVGQIDNRLRWQDLVEDDENNNG